MGMAVRAWYAVLGGRTRGAAVAKNLAVCFVFPRKRRRRAEEARRRPLPVSLLLLRRRRLGVRDLTLPRRANERGGGRVKRGPRSRVRVRGSLERPDPAVARREIAVDLGDDGVHGDAAPGGSGSRPARLVALLLRRGRRGRRRRPLHSLCLLPRRFLRRGGGGGEKGHRRVALGERRRRVSRVFFFRDARRVVAVVVAVVSRVLLAGRLADQPDQPARALRRRRARWHRALPAPPSCARSRGAAAARSPASRPDAPAPAFPRRTRARARSPRRRGWRSGGRRPGRRGRRGRRGRPPRSPGDTSEAAEPGAHPRGPGKACHLRDVLERAERARAERPLRDDGLAVLRELEQQQALHLVLLVPPRAQTRLSRASCSSRSRRRRLVCASTRFSRVPRAHERLLLRPPAAPRTPSSPRRAPPPARARIRAQGAPAAGEHELLYRVRGEHLLERRRAVRDGARGNLGARGNRPRRGGFPVPRSRTGAFAVRAVHDLSRVAPGSPFPTDGAPNRGAPLRPPSRRTYPPIAVSRYARALALLPVYQPPCLWNHSQSSRSARARSRPPHGTSRARPGPAGDRRGSPRAPSPRSRPRNWGHWGRAS